jgi:ABC-type uncharacterized transport system ATPase component
MLELTDAVVSFASPGGPVVRAVDGVSLTLPAGSFVVVIGTNGSGKSTLQGAISGAFSLDAGRVVLGSHGQAADITDWPEHRRAALVVPVDAGRIVCRRRRRRRRHGAARTGRSGDRRHDCAGHGGGGGAGRAAR